MNTFNYLGLRYFSFSVFVLASLCAEAATHFVDANVSGGSGDGSSWTNAYTSLQNALQAAAAGDEIWVAQGTYYPDEGISQTNNDQAATFQLVEGVALYGGFLNGQTNLNDRDPDTNATTLSGDIDQNGLSSFNSLNVVTGGTGISDATLLDGFHITSGRGGNTTSGGGLATDQGSPRVSHCVFELNSGANGGAVTANGSFSVFTKCTFRQNIAAFRGGAVFSVGNPTFIDCEFEDNSGAIEGGALRISGSIIVNCRFSSNFSNQGSAVSATGSLRMANNVFNNNNSTGNGTIYLSQSSGSFIGSCSFSGNRVSNLGAAIFANQLNGSTTFSHCIAWSNKSEGSTNGEDIAVTGTIIPTYRYCLFENFNPVGTGNLNGNLSTNNPLFLKAGDPDNLSDTSVDLRLQANSPAVNRGDSSFLPDDWADLDNDGMVFNETVPFDILGIDRVLFNAPDLGAYESEKSILHVDQNAPSGINNGITWDNAYRFLAPAIEAALPGQELWVADGVYLPTTANSAASSLDDPTVSFQLKSEVAIYGGFSGNELQFADRNFAKNLTILSGDLENDDPNDLLTSFSQAFGTNSYHVVNGSSTTSTAILDGFYITAGKAGVAAAGTLNNQGGGILIDDGTPFIRNCFITGNSALSGVGGGAHVRANGAKPSFINCQFSGNGALSGSALAVVGSGEAVSVNSTFSLNSSVAVPAVAGAIYVLGGDLSLDNTIIWNNNVAGTSGPIESLVTNSTISRNCLIEHSNGSGPFWETSFGTDGNRNIDTNPLFVGSSGFINTNDLRLRYNSPAIDRGNRGADLDGDGPGTANISTIDKDLFAETRIADGDGNGFASIDIGAYEYQGQANSDVDGDGMSDLFELTHTQPQSDTNLLPALDLDADGLLNFEEYVFALNPLVVDANNLSLLFRNIIGESSQFFTFRYSYNEASAKFFDLKFEFSENLVDWDDVLREPSLVFFNDNVYEISLDENIEAMTKNFLRYQITQK